MVDNPEFELVDDHPNRKIINCPEWHHDFGNSCRHFGWDYATGDYILYTDDDDLVYTHCVAQLTSALEDSPDFNWGYFSINRLGERFFNIPPRGGFITGQQIFHRPIINGKEIRWGRGQNYCGDWELISRELLHLDCITFSHLVLAEIPEYHHGIIYE
jgi:glycosyltransferase involved in cell wall biosynthesis